MANLELPILWEDEDIVVVNKPPFVVVNRAESIKGETVQDWAERQLWFPTPSPREEIFIRRSGVAHRLDKETSGCLVIAKNPKALTALLAQFKTREVKKEYLALVHGHLLPDEGTIRLPLARSRHDRERWEIKYSGKMAETTWKVEEYYRQATLVRLFPRTGRTHQIRVHLAHLGFPIYADEKYLTRSLVAPDRERLAHHFLHAEKIGFFDMEHVWREVAAPLPSDMAKLLLLMESD
ncbi:MAG: RluA family pseudouridine synthase [Patescibacteria group bacterium]